MHPTDGRLEGYARRTLEPTDLLAVDGHLAACDACRSRTAALAGVAGALSDLRSDLLPIESHLSDGQVVDYAAGGLTAVARAAVDAHIAACATCAREVDEARAYARPRAGRRGVAYAAAAAALIALAIPTLIFWRSSHGPGRGAESSLAGLESLPTAERQRVRAALRAGVAEPPPDMADLGGGAETLMGASPAGSFRLMEPLATVAVSDRPTFRWQPLAGPETYMVLVSDDALRPIAESPAVSRPEWTPDEPLPRGRTYLWQVTARSGTESVTAPAPPLPPARFKVLDEETARRLEAAARDHPQSHLLLGILYAQSGARDEAAAHLAQVPPADPLFETARRTLDRVRRP